MNKPQNMVGNRHLLSMNDSILAGTHNSIAMQSQSIHCDTLDHMKMNTNEIIKQAQRNLSEKLVNSKESSLELMKDLEELTKSLPRFER